MQRQLSLWMLIAFLSSIPFALYFPELTIESKFIGDYFIHILKQFVPFLIFGTITYSVMSFGSEGSVGKIVPKTLCLYLLTTLVAISYALLVGSQIEFSSGGTIQLTAEPIDATSIDLKSTFSVLAIDFKNFFHLIIQGNPIVIMILSIVLGIIVRFSSFYKEKVVKAFSYFNDFVLRITNYLMLLAPIAIFTLFSNLLVNLEGEIVLSLIKFVLITILLFLFYMFFFYGTIIKVFCKINPYTFYKNIREPVLFAFFSSSSSATMPLTLKTADNNLKIKKEISSFVVPIGATVNMDGSAIYLGLSAIFISQLIGLDFSLHEYIIISLTATIGSIGAAGVPSVALVMMTIVFTSVGIPIEAIAIIAGIDRLLDMFRTAINVTGDLTISKVVDSINNG